MTESMIDDRIIGRKAIIGILEQMYGITSWYGVRYFIQGHHLPLRRTPAGKPMLLKHELIKYDSKWMDVFNTL